MDTSAVTGGIFSPPLLALPVHLSGLVGGPDGARAEEFAGTVTTLDDADVVLIRLEASGLTIELPLPSAIAIDLVLRVVGACGRLAKHRHDPLP
jgi:hypothetical protein